MLDALGYLDGEPLPVAAIAIPLRRIDKALTTRQRSVGLGEDVRLRGERVIGSGLELDGELIQTSAFSSEDSGRRAFGRIARPRRRS